MATYTVHYIDGDNDTFEAEHHVVAEGVYTLQDVASADGKYVEVDIIIRNIFSIRREYDE